jgi:hypothetical protein
VAPQKVVNAPPTNLAADNEIRHIMSWISPLGPHRRHQDIRKTRLEGTGNWFLLQPEFQKWSDGQSDDSNIGSILACSGILGAGKSVIWCVPYRGCESFGALHALKLIDIS